MTSSYKPTGGDGRYARLYLNDLEPPPEDEPAMTESFEALALALDEALTAGRRQDAARLIQLIRIRARRLAPYWAPAGSDSAPPACKNHPTMPATHTALMPAQAKQPDGTYDESVPFCATCAVRIGAIGFPVTAR
ncbi:hypothetical protein BBK14_01915 [Parafrankia soli]|uniref:Uncharacterized protein n=1 Tax=Parafrankia soli TaxID=2599596 RepID=A0A1S1RIJ8_9ACTN|nr:hypothetical protein [Parafrankia soli]OHV46628.1 hypothetical protein BBK14_01915 [Parafrankia soli]